MKTKDKKVHGFGINDADYNVTKHVKVNGKWKRVWGCPYYEVWHNMIRRCYDEEYLNKNPTYCGCSVWDEWMYFSNFKSWMESQDWKGKQQDKDILIFGNKIYSPETSRFVDARVNSFIRDLTKSRGDWPLGVSWHKVANKFQARCSNPFTGRYESLGLFTCPNEAHEAWRKKKHEHACALAELQTDQDIAEALRNRFK